jgi:hypothetical protein
MGSAVKIRHCPATVSARMRARMCHWDAVLGRQLESA